MDKKIKLEERVTVYGTGKGNMKKGKAYRVHPLNAEYLVKVGAATSKAPSVTE